MLQLDTPTRHPHHCTSSTTTRTTTSTTSDKGRRRCIAISVLDAATPPSRPSQSEASAGITLWGVWLPLAVLRTDGSRWPFLLPLQETLLALALSQHINSLLSLASANLPPLPGIHGTHGTHGMHLQTAEIAGTRHHTHRDPLAAVTGGANP